MNEMEFYRQLKIYGDTEGCMASLLGKLRDEGYTRLNALMLQKAFSKLDVKPQKAVVATKQETNTPKIAQNAGDDLAVRMRILIGEKNKLSNTFWEHQNNPHKCKEISVQILTYEKDIEAMREDLRHFNTHGALPEKVKDLTDTDKLPNTKFELNRKLASIRTMICQVQEELEIAATKGDKAKLNNREKRLLELKNLRDAAQNKLDDAIV